MARTFSLVTWNCRGIKQAGRREDLFYHCSRLQTDMIILQETNIQTPRERSQAQKAWTWGPSLWSLKLDQGAGGIGLLFKHDRDIRIITIVDASPGHLFLVDFDLTFPNGAPPHKYRLVTLYAPVDRRERRALWETMKDHLNTHRALIVAGDFNVRSEAEDRIAWGPQGRHATKTLSAEEKKLKELLRGQCNLNDAALDTVCSLDFLPTHHRVFYQSKFEGFSGSKMTYYHPRAVSRIDRVWCPPSLCPDKTDF